MPSPFEVAYNARQRAYTAFKASPSADTWAAYKAAIQALRALCAAQDSE